jgi:uncharacterized protein YegP (UPF0339 family)
MKKKYDFSKAIKGKFYRPKDKIKINFIHDQESRNRGFAKFEIYTDENGKYRFRLKVTGGEIIAISEGFKTIDECHESIKSFKENTMFAPIISAIK